VSNFNAASASAAAAASSSSAGSVGVLRNIKLRRGSRSQSLSAEYGVELLADEGRIDDDNDDNNDEEDAVESPSLVSLLKLNPMRLHSIDAAISGHASPQQRSTPHASPGTPNSSRKRGGSGQLIPSSPSVPIPTAIAANGIAPPSSLSSSSSSSSSNAANASSAIAVAAEMRHSQAKDAEPNMVANTSSVSMRDVAEFTRGMIPILPPLLPCPNPEFQFWSTASFEDVGSSSHAIVDGFSSRPDSPTLPDPFSSSHSFYATRPNHLSSASGIFGSAVNLAESYPSFASAPISPTSSQSHNQHHDQLGTQSSPLSLSISLPLQSNSFLTSVSATTMPHLSSPAQQIQAPLSSTIPPLLRSESPITFGLADFMAPPRSAYLDFNEGGERGGEQHSLTASIVSANVLSVDSSSSNLSVSMMQS
jgi:hypothetical protein